MISRGPSGGGPSVASGNGAGTSGTPTATTSLPNTTPGATTGQAGATGTTVPDFDAPCEQVIVNADRSIPDMLIVLDRSQSMQTVAGNPTAPPADPDAGMPAAGGGGANPTGVDRWTASVEAIKTVTSELENDVRFGLMTFPTGDDFLGCGAGTLNEPLALQNATAIGARLDGMGVAGMTPTSATLAAAGEVLAQNPRTTDEGFPLPQYIMLVTDGDPNCVATMDAGGGLLGGILGGGGFGPGQPDVMAQEASIMEIQKLAGNMAFTYVIGVDTAETAFAPLLDQMAVAGMTGDMAHRSVTSGEELLETFRDIAGAAATCSFVLAKDVEEARVRITINGAEGEYGVDWDLRDDKRTIDLLGAACDALQVGAVIDATVECQDIRLL